MPYCVNEQHRNGNRAKSQWRISIPEEIASFEESERNGWLLTDNGWGLYMAGGCVSVLGVAQDHITPVFIAKYVGSADGPWHGYPADYRNKAQDIPVPDVLCKWLSEGLMTPAKIRKISRGQPCSL